MFDIKWIRANAEAFDAAVSRRKNVSVRASDLIAIDERRRAVITRLNEAQEKRNALSKQIGQAKAQKDETRAQALMADTNYEYPVRSSVPDGKTEKLFGPIKPDSLSLAAIAKNRKAASELVDKVGFDN